MVKKRHTAAQMIAKLREAEIECARGRPISMVVSKLRIAVVADKMHNLAQRIVQADRERRRQ